MATGRLWAANGPQQLDDLVPQPSEQLAHQGQPTRAHEGCRVTARAPAFSDLDLLPWDQTTCEDGEVPVSSGDLPGDSLVEVAIAWHVYEGKPADYPIRVWIRLARLGSLELNCAGTGSLRLAADEPGTDYDMAQQGNVAIRPAAADFALSPYIGHEIRSLRHLYGPFNNEIGLVLEFSAGSVGVANVADDLWVLSWPNPAWDEAGVHVAP